MKNYLTRPEARDLMADITVVPAKVSWRNFEGGWGSLFTSLRTSHGCFWLNLEVQVEDKGITLLGYLATSRNGEPIYHFCGSRDNYVDWDEYREDPHRAVDILRENLAHEYKGFLKNLDELADLLD